MQPVANRTVVSFGELRGYVHDGKGAPLSGVFVTASAVGVSPMYAHSDVQGRYVFRNLAPGAYLLRVFLEGYTSPQGRYMHVTAGARVDSEIALNRVPPPEEKTNFLAAGVVAIPTTRPTPSEPDETTELEWRLGRRRAKPGVLKDAVDTAIASGERPDGESAIASLRHTFGSPSRLVSIFDSVNGQVNLLTTTSFDRPQDIFDSSAGAPQPVAFVSLVAPVGKGDWAVRGSMTQGDISSWILAGSFTRHRDLANHRYEVGLSYATQHYQGANTDVSNALRNDSRNVGEIYAQDSWDIVPRLSLATGGRYASYDYLADRYLLGGRLSLAYQVMPDDPLRLRVTGIHKEMAPGAEEFVAPASGVWLPPERTFSALRRGGELRPEKVNMVEISGERPVAGDVVIALRAFRQEVGDQLVTLFGPTLLNPAPSLGHYRVASAGDFENYGWGVTVQRHVIGSTQASVDYTMTDTTRRDLPADRLLLRFVAPATLRREERIHDLTASVNSRIAPTATRFIMVYKLNNAYAESDSRDPQTGARFDLQVNQEMPFLNFTGARWEMLVGVRNLFRNDLFDGSVYDELLVVRPPKRITGGVTVWF